MKHLKLILILTFFTQLSFSQSISSYLLNVDKINSKKKIIEVIETTTFYNNTGETKDVEYKTYDSLMNILSLKRFDSENKLIWLTIYKYDSLSRIIRVDKKNWINVVGYQTSYAIYQYDSLGNYVQLDYNDNRIVLNITKFYFDTNKNLTRLETYTDNGSLIGYELAKYDKENNQVSISQYNSQDQLINTSNQPISYDYRYKQKPSNKYNEYGDLIYWDRDWNGNDRTCYKTEYKYDKYNNWLSEKRYSFIKSDNGELKKKKLEMIKTREIKY
jgi:hypothetical protein